MELAGWSLEQAEVGVLAAKATAGGNGWQNEVWTAHRSRTSWQAILRCSLRTVVQHECWKSGALCAIALNFASFAASASCLV